ncbi:MAG: zinc metallopeptidase, partial [Planctomycetota bacterium]
MFFDPLYFVFILPAVGLMLWAQWRVKATYAQGDRIGANLSGAAAARHILDAAGLHNVGVEQTEGFLSDHYDPRAKVLRLSPGVYNNRTASAVGIAAHEAGHALQDAEQYGPLVVRNFAVPIATLGSSVVNFVMMAAFGALFIGAGKLFPLLLLAALGGYVAILAFQLVNLPVEFDASNR